MNPTESQEALEFSKSLEQAIFEAAKERLFEIEAEWQRLGFWSRVWRGYEFRIRKEIVLRTGLFYGSSGKDQNTIKVRIRAER